MDSLEVKRQKEIDDNRLLNHCIITTWFFGNLVIAAKMLDWWVF